MFRTRESGTTSVTIDMRPGVKRVSSKELVAMSREERMEYRVEFKAAKLGSSHFGHFELTPRRESERFYSRIGKVHA